MTLDDLALLLAMLAAAAIKVLALGLALLSSRHVSAADDRPPLRGPHPAREAWGPVRQPRA